MSQETFGVETLALRELAHHLDPLAENAAPGGPADSYIREHLTLDWTDTAVLFAAARSSIHDARDAITGMLAAHSAALRASARELEATAADYDATDERIRAGMDLLQFGGALLAGAPDVPIVLCTPTTPADILTPPDRRAEEDLAARILGTNWLSPTGVVRELMDFVFDYDPLREVHQVFTGNWRSLFAAASATDNLARLLVWTGGEVTMRLGVCTHSWTGGAANAAAAYFLGFSRECVSNAEALEMFADGCQRTAECMEDAAAQLGDIFGTILDLIIAAQIAYALGLATSETGIGGVLGVLAGTGALGTAVWLATRAWDVIQEAKTYLDILTTAVGVIVGNIGTDPAFTLPAAYDNPRV